MRHSSNLYKITDSDFFGANSEKVMTFSESSTKKSRNSSPCPHGRPKIAIEVKTGTDTPSKNFHILGDAFPQIEKIQLVENLKREKTFPDGIEIRDLANWLKTLPFTT